MKSKKTVLITLIAFFLLSAFTFAQVNSVSRTTTVSTLDTVALFEILDKRYALKGEKPEHPIEPQPPNEEVFLFDDDRIVQGGVSDDVALRNKEIVSNAIRKAKDGGYTIFEFAPMDFYVEVGADNFNRATDNCIKLQSNMEYRLNEQTYIRVQPNDRVSYAIFGIRKGENIKISGGNLIGDRLEHDYVQNGQGNDGNTHEFGYGVYPRGVINFTLENVNISNMTGDCFIAQSSSQRNDDGTEKPNEIYNKNWLIKGCTLDNARRNNISFTDVDGAIIRDCIIKNGGSNGYEGNMNGISPASNIDLEAWVVPDGDYRITEIVQNVKIFNNTFSGGNMNDIIFQRCNNVEVYGNTFDNATASVTSHNVYIHDNTYLWEGDYEGRQRAIHIATKLENGVETNYNYRIENNTIKGFKTGITLGGNDNTVSDNTIEECYTGVMLSNSSNNHFDNNTIVSTINASRGYYTLRGVETTVLIEGGLVDVSEFAILLQDTGTEITVNGGTYKGFKGVEFRDSGVINLNGVDASKVTNKNSDININ